jgi:hypothetical protein
VKGSETTFVSTQWLSKCIPATTEILLETVFSILFVERGYKEDNWGNRVSSVEEAVEKNESRKGYWKGAAVQGGLEHGSRGIVIVRNRYQ